MNIEKPAEPILKNSEYKFIKNIDSHMQMSYFAHSFCLNYAEKSTTQIVFKGKVVPPGKAPNPFLPGTFEKYFKSKTNFKTRKRKISKSAESPVIKEKDELYAKYLQLLDEINHLKSENEKLKTTAYKSYEDLKEEQGYEISRATCFQDSLLILLELKENRKLNYWDLTERVTEPGHLFIRLSDLASVHFIEVEEKSGYFTITPRATEFLEKRGL